MAKVDFKACPTCKQTLPASAFAAAPQHASGLRSCCRSCENEQNRAYRERDIAKTREQARKRTRKYREKHPEAAKGSRQKAALKMKYGLTMEQYEALSAAQNHRCAICAKHRSLSRYGKLSVDHCHDSNFIRGLLCNDCNRNLISHRTDPEIFLRAAAYVANSRVGKIAA